MASQGSTPSSSSMTRAQVRVGGQGLGSGALAPVGAHQRPPGRLGERRCVAARPARGAWHGRAARRPARSRRPRSPRSRSTSSSCRSRSPAAQSANGSSASRRPVICVESRLGTGHEALTAGRLAAPPGRHAPRRGPPAPAPGRAGRRRGGHQRRRPPIHREGAADHAHVALDRGDVRRGRPAVPQPLGQHVLGRPGSPRLPPGSDQDDVASPPPDVDLLLPATSALSVVPNRLM